MPTLPSECEQLLISGYVLGDLSPAEALLFEELLRENPDLIEQVSMMQQVLDLAYAPVEVAPPDSLRDRLLATANSQKIETETVESSADTDEEVAATTSRLPRGKILGAIALAIATTLAVTNYLWWQNAIQTAKTTDMQSTQSDRLTYLLQDKDPNKKYTAKLTVDGDRLDATLVTNDLPPLPPDKVYALWTVVGKDIPYTTDEKGAILTAVFQVPQSGNITQEIAVPQPHLEPRTIKKIAITVEDISAPQAHEGSIFISTND